MARHRVLGRSLRSRRQTSWGLGPGSESVTTVSSSANTIIGSGVALVTEPKSTLIRIRGELTIMLSAITSALDGFQYAAGICLVGGDAFTAGAGSLPDPQDDSIWPWLWHSFGNVFEVTAALTGNDLTFRRHVIDSKAMRIVNSDQILCMMLSTTESGAATAKVRFDSRTLDKLF